MKPFDDAANAVSTFGFTPRQARFLTLVMRHAGLCLPRQYATFAGTAYGRQVNQFFSRLVAAGWASSWACVHNRARLYHVHAKTLYRAIGDPDSRYRRAVAPRGVRPRIERLDALLSAPTVRWFATEGERTQGLIQAGSLASSEAPALVGLTAAYCQGDEPLFGVEESGRVNLLFLVRSPDPSRTASLVRPSLPLLRALPRWVILLRTTFPWAPSCKDHSLAIDADMRPLSPSVLADLRWYFQKRHEPTAGRVAAIAKRLGDMAFTYRDERYDDLYRRWLSSGEQVFDESSSTVLEEARRSHAGHIHYRALPHAYRHLDPLLQPRSRRRAGVEAGERQPHVPSTPSSTTTRADGFTVTPSIADVDEPRIRRIDRGVRVGGARGQARRRVPRQASLFDQEDGWRA